MELDLTEHDSRTHALRGCEMRDCNGEFIGTIEDVIFDEVSQRPKLLVVHPTGWMHALLHDDHYVPAAHGHLEGDTVITGYAHDEVLHAPIAPWRHHIVDRETEHEIEEHYHLVR